jgi:hypothetical protein
VQGFCVAPPLDEAALAEFCAGRPQVSVA